MRAIKIVSVKREKNVVMETRIWNVRASPQKVIRGERQSPRLTFRETVARQKWMTNGGRKGGEAAAGRNEGTRDVGNGDVAGGDR
jgi:hypothetical protein